jgi:hypothetical protein
VFVTFAKLEHNSGLPILMFEAVSILDQFLPFSGDDVMRVSSSTTSSCVMMGRCVMKTEEGVRMQHST